jgi:Zn-dependent M28 family amino/carboxypeptidase
VTASVAFGQGAVNRTQLLEDLRRLSADEMQGREAGTIGGAKARTFIVERLGAVGLRPIGERFEWPFDLGSRRTAGTGTAGTANVIGLLAGTRSPAKFLVVSAHYDHLGVQRGEVFNGADDNASGTAALFALAGHFAKARTGFSLLFVGFDAEERGLAGSRAFVASPPVPRDAILLNLNLDMIARDERNELWISGVRAQPALGPIIDKVAKAAPVRLRTGYDDPTALAKDWVRQSDQWSFIEAGIPGLYVGVPDEQHYHRASDDFDNITPDFYVNAVETIVQLIRAFDADYETLLSLERGEAARGGRR